MTKLEILQYRKGPSAVSKVSDISKIIIDTLDNVRQLFQFKPNIFFYFKTFIFMFLYAANFSQ